MNTYELVKTLHIISSTVLFGTGLGIAFFFWRAQRSADLAARAFAARTTVLADTCFTLPAVVLQPATGLWLMHEAGYDFSEPWLLLSFALYGLAGLCWLPVVWLQIHMRNILQVSLTQQTPLPAAYDRYFRWWFALGWPAFGGLIVVFYLMVVKPSW